MIDVKLIDGQGSGKSARISELGSLIVGPEKPSETKFLQLDTINTPFNFFKPIAGISLCITGFIINADRNVGVNGATVEIYESDAVDSLTVIEPILTIDIDKQKTLPIIPVLIAAAPGSFVNAKTDDTNINLTMLAFTIKVS